MMLVLPHFTAAADREKDSLRTSIHDRPCSACDSNKLTFPDTPASPVSPPVAAPAVGDEDDNMPPMFQPGKLTTMKSGLLLSEGLDARIIATATQAVPYDVIELLEDGVTFVDRSSEKFHQRPDGGATYWDTDPLNVGGWVYVSNSEMMEEGKGGVGRIKFDRNGNVLDYRMLLTGTTMNCNGGKTPWNTWVSCEEVEDVGQLYQVDPTGNRPPELMSMASEGGMWEAFAYDDRDRDVPRFFVSEDHHKGTLRRFTPAVTNWDDPWQMLHGPGTTQYLMVVPNATNNGGTFKWTTNFNKARNNAYKYYQHTEGIDVYKGQLFFVCKKIKQLFALDLDNFTYYNHTTHGGLFGGTPDQMARIIGDKRGLAYFTEDGSECKRK